METVCTIIRYLLNGHHFNFQKKVMQPIRIILEHAPKSIAIPTSLLDQRVEIIMRQIPATTSTDKVEQEVNRVFGILKAEKSVTLEEMDEAISKEGGSL